MPFKKLIPFSSLFLFNYIVFLRKQCTLIFLIDNEKRYVWFISAAAAAKSLQSCPTLCDPRDGSAPGSPIPGILQARTLEWVAISFSNAWKWKVKVKSLSRARLLVTPWTAAHQAPPSMGFSRQEYWSGSPLIKGLHCVYTVLLYDLAQVIQSKLGMKLFCAQVLLK